MATVRMLRSLLHLFALLAVTCAALAISPALAADSPGAVYVLTNQVSGNAVAVYTRAADGMLTLANTVATGGLGTGAALGSQGAVTLSDDGRWLVAVNAGSDDISVFDVQPYGLVLVDRVPSGGTRPTSVTIRKQLVYVLNAGAEGNISGFRLGSDGHLVALAGSTRFLSNAGVGAAPAPAQVSFSPSGDVLVVTERGTNLIDVYTLDENGLATGSAVYPSSGATPFGFAFTQQGTLVVSEAAGGAVNGSSVSSYAVSPAGLQVVTPSSPTGETAACWIAVSKNGKFAYSANAGSASVSSYRVGQDGSLALIAGKAGETGAGTAPVDMATSHNSQHVYVLSARSQNVIVFAAGNDGSLTPIGTFGGLPAGSAGIAAW